MAKIVATFDTVSKEFNVTKDGAIVANVEYAAFGRSYDEKKFGCSIEVMEKDEENDMRQMTRMVASENGELVNEKAESDTARSALAKLLKRS